MLIKVIEVLIHKAELASVSPSLCPGNGSFDFIALKENVAIEHVFNLT